MLTAGEVNLLGFSSGGNELRESEFPVLRRLSCSRYNSSALHCQLGVHVQERIKPRRRYTSVKAFFFFACLIPCNVVAQLVTSQQDVVAQLVTSQLIAEETTVTFFSHSDVLGPSRITRKYLTLSTVHSAIELVLCCFPLLHGSGAGYLGFVVLSGDGIRSRS